MDFPPIAFHAPADEWGDYFFTEVYPEDFSVSREEQARSVFRRMEKLLEPRGMDFGDVVRTWLYADRILEWYPALNAVRDEFFRSRGVYDRYVPASTGIGWTSPCGAKFVAAIFAARSRLPDSLTVRALPSPLQCPALEYGSSFSRAAEIVTPAWRRVLVSGTASIEAGSHEVAHAGDIDAQIDCTMRAVAAIFESRGMALRDVDRALVYLKRPEYRAAWDRWLGKHPEYPAACAGSIVADVCRDEWLFEIEADARVDREFGKISV